MTVDSHKLVALLLENLKELAKQRSHIDQQITNDYLAFRSVVRDIADHKEREEFLREAEALRRKPAGLTETISKSMRDMLHSSLSASEVREWLEREGFDLSDYSQPLATISVTLARLAKSGRVKATRKRRKVTYQWIGE